MTGEGIKGYWYQFHWEEGVSLHHQTTLEHQQVVGEVNLILTLPTWR